MAAQIPPGPGERVTYRVNPNGGPNIVTRERVDPAAQRAHAVAVARARKSWTDASTAGRLAALRLRHAREREAGLAWAAKYGYLF